MPLADDEIALIAQWQPIQEGFGREDDQTGIRIRSIVDRINSADGIGCELLEDDGLCNYFVLFAFNLGDVPANAISRKVDGHLIYLSACGPIGVVGRSRKCVGHGFSSHDSLEIATLLSPERSCDCLEEAVFAAIHWGGYEVLSAEEVSRPLPPGVTPFEYCPSPEPWDRVFHALFGNTD